MSNCSIYSQVPLIDVDDFKCVVDIVRCDDNRLCSSIVYAQEVLLPEFLGCANIYNSVINDRDNTLYTTLICGGEYECDGVRVCAGIKKVLIYLAYSEYIKKVVYYSYPVVGIGTIDNLDGVSGLSLESARLFSQEQLDNALRLIESVNEYICCEFPEMCVKKCNCGAKSNLKKKITII